MLVLTGQRVYVASIHIRAVGAESLQIMKELVKASALTFVFIRIVLAAFASQETCMVFVIHWIVL